MIKLLVGLTVLFSSTTWSAEDGYKIICDSSFLNEKVTVTIEGNLQKNFLLKPTSIKMEAEPSLDAKYHNLPYVESINDLLPKLQQFKMYKGELFLVATAPDFQTLMIEANLNDAGKGSMTINSGFYEKAETVCKVSMSPFN